MARIIAKESCSWKCEAELPCGHLCGRLRCDHDDNHNTTEGCREPCSRRCERGHLLGCKKFCFEPCDNTKCQVKVKKKLRCGHVVVHLCSKPAPKCNCGGTGVKPATISGKAAETGAVGLEPPQATSNDTSPSTTAQPGQCSRTCISGFPCSRIHPIGTDCPPCDQANERKYKDCGHHYLQRCGDNTEPICVSECNRQLKCGHKCRLMCSVKCDSQPCQTKIKHKFQRCGHVSEIICSEEAPLCHQTIPGVLAQCGHPVTLPCFYTISDPKFFNRFCEEKCSSQLSCGHICFGNCYKCHLGRFHVRCKEKCGKSIICGHVCTTGCSNACPPCNKPCENYCEHGPCTKPCGVPCDEQCQLPCLYQCTHYQCSMKCGQKCDRPPCNRPCRNTLPCGHRCVGFCGEACSPLCRHCDKEQLLSESLGMIDIEGDSELRFVYLKCGHTIEVNILEQWLRTSGSDGEIKPKQCPFCRTIIWRNRRFNFILAPVEREVMEVKRKIYGDPMENAKKEADLLGELNKLQEREVKRFGFFFDHLRNLFRPEIEHHHEKSKTRLEAIEELIRMYSFAEDFMEIYHALFGDMKDKFTDSILTTIAKCFDYAFTKLKSTQLPLTEQEAKDSSNELTRIEHMRQLLERQHWEETIRKTTANKFSKAYMERLETAAKYVFNVYSAYDIRRQLAFLQKLKGMDNLFGTTLGIGDRERVAIVQVFGKKTGRWFKCRNGHIYVITECGGPTQEGICNECGVPIGGQHHSLLEDNQLASEMDGAQRPLYPTALER